MPDKQTYKLGRYVFCIRRMQVGEIELIKNHTLGDYHIRVYFEETHDSEWYTHDGKFEVSDEHPALLMGKEDPNFSHRFADVS